jgi:ParB family chromosome partitioning protein
MAATRKKKPLGRNLDALLGKTRAAAEEASPEGELTGLRELPLDVIEPGRYQPRSAMDPDRLQELADSITEQGLVQPVVVRPLARQGRYELIAGERRWRACRMAGLETIPALVREIADEATLALALIENIQREDLNPLEEAVALRRLIEEFGLTHEQAARSVGRSRTSVTNLLRLMELAPEVREMVDHKQLDMGHARALLTLERSDQVRAAHEVVTRDLTVRQTEALVRRLRDGTPAKKPAAAKKSPEIERLEQELTETLCAPVTVKHSASGKGQVTIKYTSLDELDGLLERFRH